ncbi:hypothetical protein GGR16_002401 [Chelatococcus caeni]|uniref:Head fiber protein n=1 Tax=Chelatococcus caeni TaxID=1348468 RepID=A0A840C078_9HYPH|nr:head fiber protein [Chelatococcus caeni]MBB4017372.1 hypothetical protein [Chelatococcus caeni]
MSDYAPKGRLAVAELIVGRSISGAGAPAAGIPQSEKGAPNGVATLDEEGKLDAEQFGFGGIGDPAGPLDEGGQMPASQIPAATQTDAGGVRQMAPIADLSDAPTQQDFNDLLAALRDAGILATS